MQLLDRTARPLVDRVRHTAAVVARRARSDTGDVPGWVLITLMTAGLVILIWGLAGPALSSLFQNAISRVTGF